MRKSRRAVGLLLLSSGGCSLGLRTPASNALRSVPLPRPPVGCLPPRIVPVAKGSQADSVLLQVLGSAPLRGTQGRRTVAGDLLIQVMPSNSKN